MEKYYDLLSKKDKARMALVHTYLSEFGSLILKKQLPPSCAMDWLAKKNNTSRQNIRQQLIRAGAYKNKFEPVIYEADADYEELNKPVLSNLQG